MQSVARRSGQPEFRKKLLKAYGRRCAITGTRAEFVLEAAHIISYKGDATDHLQNGLLLRSDIHTLFDLGLIAIDSAKMGVLVSPTLKKSLYGVFANRRLRLPEKKEHRPCVEALDIHRKNSGL
jgi:putative restriction endonuclease